MAHEWNAVAYDRLPLPHVAWGQRVLDRMAAAGFTGHGRVLDAGCGTGRDAAALLERWPAAEVIGLDASANMVAQARQRLGDRAQVEVADLTEALPIAPVDAVMSVAAFHWIADHDVLFGRLAEAMNPGATLTTDCGGEGQLAVLEVAIERVTGQAKAGTDFKGVAQTRASLERAGFTVQDVRLRPDPLRIEDPELMEAYLATVNVSNYLVDLPPAEQPAFVRAVRKAMPEPVIDYVRLEIDAVRN